MADIETANPTNWPLSAEELASRMCHLFPGHVGYPSEQARLMRCIEADRDAVHLAAKRELLSEFQTALDIQLALTGNDSLRSYARAHGSLLAKYSPTSKEARGG